MLGCCDHQVVVGLFWVLAWARVLGVDVDMLDWAILDCRDAPGNRVDSLLQDIQPLPSLNLLLATGTHAQINHKNDGHPDKQHRPGGEEVGHLRPPAVPALIAPLVTLVVWSVLGGCSVAVQAQFFGSSALFLFLSHCRLLLSIAIITLWVCCATSIG